MHSFSLEKIITFWSMRTVPACLLSIAETTCAIELIGKDFESKVIDDDKARIGK